MKRVLITCLAVVMLILPLGACMEQVGPLTGGGVGAGGGAILGAMIDHRNRWRGAVIGGVAGAVLGGTLGYIIQRSNQQAAQYNRPVQYTSTDGRQKVVSTPIGRDPNTGCTIVREDVYVDGRLARSRRQQVCR